jgi:hypothetical protein
MMLLTNGQQDVTTYFVLRDSTDHEPKTDVVLTDIDLYYVEELAAISAKADCAALGAANSPHTDNSAFNVGQGLYRIDWPDAAFDGGIGKKVQLIVICSGVDTTFFEAELSAPMDLTPIAVNVVSANPAYMHNPLIDQDSIVVAQVGLVRNKPAAAPIQIAEITTPGLIKIWRYRKGTDSDWTLIVAGGGMGAGIGSIYFQYTFPSASWADGDLILYEVYDTVVELDGEVFTLSTVQGFGVIGDTISVAAIKAVTDTLPAAGMILMREDQTPLQMVLTELGVTPKRYGAPS